MPVRTFCFYLIFRKLISMDYSAFGASAAGAGASAGAAGFLFALMLMIAFVGHSLAHRPQFLQVSGLMYARLFSTVIASNLQTLAHLPQPIQALEQFFLATAPLSLELHCTITLFFAGAILITLFGHCFAQIPQPTHSSLFTTARPLQIWIAP